MICISLCVSLSSQRRYVLPSLTGLFTQIPQQRAAAEISRNLWLCPARKFIRDHVSTSGLLPQQSRPVQHHRQRRRCRFNRSIQQEPRAISRWLVLLTRCAHIESGLK
jgi:hypothetical protein